MRLIPVWLAVAVAGGSWWILREAARGPMVASQATITITPDASQTTATSPKTSDFPVTWNGDQPTEVNLDEYRLRVDGDVSNPLKLTLDNLRAMFSVQRTLKIICMLGWAAEVSWEGIPLSDLLSLAGTPKKIDHITVESVTGYKRMMSSDEVAKPDNIIALKAGGVPLTVEHGYPARLVAPTRIGADWVKYVGRITCTSR